LGSLHLRVFFIFFDGAILLVYAMFIFNAGLDILLGMNLVIEYIRPPYRLPLIEFSNITYEFRNEGLELHVDAEVAPRQDLLTALGTFFLVLTVVIFNALGAKFMQTVLDVEWAREHIRTNLT
jgi:hypothetical protein